MLKIVGCITNDQKGGHMTRGAAWNAADLTGGPLDDVFAALWRTFADLKIERLEVTHPADDDNVWFVTRRGGDIELQVDSMPNGSPPFLIESDEERRRADDVETAMTILSEWLNI